LAGMPYAPQRVIGLHIGPKNPGFNESQFPDIKFYYTPKIKWSTKKVAGTPEVLSRWLDKGGLRLDEAIVLDKNGTGAFIGFIMKDKALTENFSQGDLDSLGNVLKSVVEENRETPFSKSTPLDPQDLSGMLGRKFPSFEVVNASGEASWTGSIIASSLPTMIFVFRIPPDHQFKSPEEAMKDVESPLQALSGMANVFVSDEYLALLKKIEEDLYGR